MSNNQITIYGGGKYLKNKLDYVENLVNEVQTNTSSVEVIVLPKI